uniref:Uncharacterized protein n=1 Tax=Rhizophora mucronata TaxID=61149 RepID=A0A2P2NYZ4_RHIMU
MLVGAGCNQMHIALIIQVAG